MRLCLVAAWRQPDWCLLILQMTGRNNNETHQTQHKRMAKHFQVLPNMARHDNLLCLQSQCINLLCNHTPNPLKVCRRRVVCNVVPGDWSHLAFATRQGDLHRMCPVRGPGCYGKSPCRRIPACTCGRFVHESAAIGRDGQIKSKWARIVTQNGSRRHHRVMYARNRATCRPYGKHVFVQEFHNVIGMMQETEYRTQGLCRSQRITPGSPSLKRQLLQQLAY